MGHLATEAKPGVDVDAGVLAGEDATEGGLIGGGLEAGESASSRRAAAGEVTLRSRVVPVEGGQDGGGRCADGAVGGRIGGVGGGVDWAWGSQVGLAGSTAGLVGVPARMAVTGRHSW